MGVWSDIFSGNFSKVPADFAADIAGLPAPVQTFLVKIENDAEGLLMSLAQTAYNDVVAGGLTTASFVAAGKDVVAKAAAQGAAILMSDAMVAVNLVASSVGVKTAAPALVEPEPTAS